LAFGYYGFLLRSRFVSPPTPGISRVFENVVGEHGRAPVRNERMWILP
jgi:hypothetical protein